jgi:hypothetical protein
MVFIDEASASNRFCSSEVPNSATIFRAKAIASTVGGERTLTIYRVSHASRRAEPSEIPTTPQFARSGSSEAGQMIDVRTQTVSGNDRRVLVFVGAGYGCDFGKGAFRPRIGVLVGCFDLVLAASLRFNNKATKSPITKLTTRSMITPKLDLACRSKRC